MLRDREPKCYVRKVANVFDAATRTAYETFEFLDVQGQVVQVDVPRQDSLSAANLVNIIRGQNGRLPKNKEARKHLVENAINTDPKKYYRRAPHVGWVVESEDRPKAFVIGTRVIALSEAGCWVRAPSWLDGNLLLPPAPAGSIATWKAEIAEPAMRSSRMGFALMAAFAAPLLIITGSPNFILNFYHKAKAGKSTILLVAGSVAGPGEESDMPNWKATLSGGQQTVRAHNDTCFFINETGLIEDRKRAYPKIRDWIYWLAEGREAIKNSQSAFAARASSSKFRCVALSSSEHSFDAFAVIAGLERDGGEYARCSDIPACADGQETIFDWSWEEDDVTPEFARAELIRLRDACRRNHGVAIEPYVKFLAENWSKVPLFIEMRISEFLDRIGVDNLSNVQHHVARNFGLIYAAGRLAVMAKVLPWSADDPYHYAEACFLAAIKAAQAKDDLLEAGKKVLEEALHGNDQKRSFSVWPDVSGKIGGVRRDGQRQSYVCKTGPFRDLFDGEEQARLVVNWLCSEGKMIVAPHLSPADVWQGKTVRWPSCLKPSRSYEFTDPFNAEEET